MEVLLVSYISNKPLQVFQNIRLCYLDIPLPNCFTMLVFCVENSLKETIKIINFDIFCIKDLWQILIPALNYFDRIYFAVPFGFVF